MSGERRTPAGALAAHLARRSVRATWAWAVASCVVLWSSALTYADAYPTASQRAALGASLSSNAGLQALFGSAHHLDTVWGFTAWRGIGLLVLVGGVWGVLRGTALLRGEEDAGRWEPVLAGALGRGIAASAGVVAAATAIAVLAVGAAAGVAFAATVRPVAVPAAAFLVATIVAVPTVFVALGLLCGQLFASRRRAATAAGALFGAAFLVRVVAVATDHRWLLWVTPVGWVDEARPLAGSSTAPLILSYVLAALLAVASVACARARDLGTALVTQRERVPSSTLMLRSLPGFSARLVLAPLAGWAAALTVLATALGLVSNSVSEVANGSGTVRSLAARLGAGDAGDRIFLGIAMVVLMSAAALAAAGQLTALRAQEASSVLDALLVLPVSRRAVLLVRVAVLVAGLAGLGSLVGLVLWAATSAGGAHIGAGTLVAAGLNGMVLAVVVGAAGALVFGVRPRWVAAIGYGLVAWSFLVEMVGSLASAPSWLLDLSVLHHIAPAPAASPRWGTDAVLLAFGGAALAVGTLAFTRRDVTAG